MPSQARIFRSAPARPSPAPVEAAPQTVMDPHALPGARPVGTDHGPKTFAERGVAVPFTTPLLSQARLRADRGGALEVLLPNPAGMRGTYVVAWQGLRGLARLTVHDMRMLELLGGHGAPTPDSVRRAARTAAIEGLAGRAARRAAATAREIARHQAAHAAFALLVRAHGTATGEVTAPEDAVREGDAFRARARTAIAGLAQRTGVALDRWLAMTEALAPQAAAIGIPDPLPGTPASLAPQVALLAEAFRRGPEELRAAAILAEAAAACATNALAEARRALADMPSVALAWAADPLTLLALLERPAWVLDGWDHLLALWHSAKAPEARDAAVQTIAMLAPALPAQATAWTGLPVPPPAPGRPAMPAQDWRATALINDQVAQLEALRALVP
jgi:hypothetical protein